MNNERKNKNNNILIIILLVLILSALAVMVFVDGPDPSPKVIKNLQLKQKGLTIEMSWDPVDDCRGYNVRVSEGPFKTKLTEIDENTYVIKDIEPKQKYYIKVTAIMNDGEESVATFSDIRARKLKQKIKVDPESIDGFKGDTFRIKASAKGEITYESGNEQLLTVNQNGKVTLKGKGHARVLVIAEGDDIYSRTKVRIPVNIYPENLAKTAEVTAENVSSTRAKISWRPTEYATEYVLMKRNPATDKYEDKRTVNGEETSVEITRDNGKYAIKAVAEVGGKTVEGRMSDPVEINGTVEDAKKYSSSTTLKKLRPSSNLKLVRTINGVDGITVPQSMCATDDCYVVAYVNHNGTSGRLVSYKKSDGQCVDITATSGMGHANGSTYNPNTNKIYTVKTHKNIRTAACTTFDGDTKKAAGTFTLPRVTSGIAYDVSNNKYYLSKGNEIYVCDSNFKVEKFIHKFIRYNHAQDIGAYNGMILVCTWVNGNTSYIDCYRASDGGYLGTYDVCFGEVESCLVEDGYLVILMNNLHTRQDSIYKTKERISFD